MFPVRNANLKRLIGWHCEFIKWQIRKLDTYRDLSECQDMFVELLAMVVDKKSMARDKEQGF